MKERREHDVSLSSLVNSRSSLSPQFPASEIGNNDFKLTE
jgi:hypothetical protein